MTLIITLLIGSFTIQTDNLEACQQAGHNLIHHENALHQSDRTDSYFFCISAETGEVWTSVELPVLQ